MAAVCLHNFRIMEKESIEEFIEPSGLFNRNEIMESLNPSSGKLFGDSRGHSEVIRRELAEYFINGGSVYWQDNFVY